MIRHGAIVLAAGRSRRLGVAKQHLLHRGATLEHNAVSLALATEPAELLLVRAEDDEAPLPAGSLRCIRAPAGGMGRSLAAAVAASELAGPARQALVTSADGSLEAGAWLVLLVDQIGLRAAHLSELLRLWRTDPLRPVASRYADTVGVPALLPWHWRPRLLQLAADEGARAWLRDEPELRTVAAAALAVDLDQPDQLGILR